MVIDSMKMTDTTYQSRDERQATAKAVTRNAVPPLRPHVATPPFISDERSHSALSNHRLAVFHIVIEI